MRSRSAANPFAREDGGLAGATAAALRVAKTFQPGQAGTKGLALEFGGRLVCVRHRYDDANATRVTTVERVVDTAPLRGRAPPPRAVGEAWTLMHIRLAPDERGLRRSVLADGGRWLSEYRLWEVPRWLVARLGLHDRVVGGSPALPASAGSIWKLRVGLRPAMFAKAALPTSFHRWRHPGASAKISSSPHLVRRRRRGLARMPMPQSEGAL